MKKPSYTITLNFFVPDEVVENLWEVRVSGKVLFDWRKHRSAHCTVKAIYHGTEIPDEKIIQSWAEVSKPILSQQKPFEVLVEGITQWPTALVSNVLSEELLKLHQKLFKVLPSIQPRFEDDNYHPHVSIARIREEVKVDPPARTIFGKFKVDEIQLMLWGMKDLKKAAALYTFKLGRHREKSPK
jgi:2'-5' RNA ligase